MLGAVALLHASGQQMPISALAAAAMAACSALCAFTSLQRTEVLTAVRERCSPPNYLMPSALSDEAVLQQVEQQLPGAQAALLLTVVEAHLEESDTVPGRPMLPFSGVILSAHGAQLGETLETHTDYSRCFLLHCCSSCLSFGECSAAHSTMIRLCSSGRRRRGQGHRQGTEHSRPKPSQGKYEKQKTTCGGQEEEHV